MVPCRLHYHSFSSNVGYCLQVASLQAISLCFAYFDNKKCNPNTISIMSCWSWMCLAVKPWHNILLSGLYPANCWTIKCFLNTHVSVLWTSRWLHCCIAYVNIVSVRPPLHAFVFMGTEEYLMSLGVYVLSLQFYNTEVLHLYIYFAPVLVILKHQVSVVFIAVVYLYERLFYLL